MGTVRYVKVFLVLSVGIWGLIGTIGNLSGLPDVYSSVRDVTTMSGVPEGVGPPWKTANPFVVWTGVVAIVLGKLAALFGGGFGGVMMLRHINASSVDFARSKKWAVSGCGLAAGLLILSFTIIAEGAFFMFYDPRYVGAAEIAFRFAGSFALITLFVAQPEPG
jgi:predicted small integral membrane protein